MSYLARITREPLGDVQSIKDDHRIAMRLPRGQEVGIVEMVRGWLEYADSYKGRYMNLLSQDVGLGEQWANMGMSLIYLLGGTIGRLNSATLDSIIRDTLVDEGFNPDEL